MVPTDRLLLMFDEYSPLATFEKMDAINPTFELIDLKY